MSDMKCPMCNTNLEVLVGGANALLGCPRCRDKATMGLWQELIRTRKALDVAIHRLNQIAEHDCDQGCMYVAQNALEQITALEQKDVK